MTKTNNELKELATKLREKGVMLKDIVNETGLSKATLKRHFKKIGLVGTRKNIDIHDNKNKPTNEPTNEPTNGPGQDKDHPEHESPNRAMGSGLRSSYSLTRESVVRQSANGDFAIYKSKRDAPEPSLRKPDSRSVILHEVKTPRVNLTRESKRESDVNLQSGIMDAVKAHPLVVTIAGTVLGGLALKYATEHMDLNKDKEGDEDW